MNRSETVRTDTEIKSFIEKNKLRSLFSELTKELVVKQPEDPINYLIDYLFKRNKRQVICINGYDHENRVRVSNAVANKFNYKHINLSELFPGDFNSVSDQILNEKVLENLKKVETVYKGVVISGYPNNIVQADFIQKSGILPDRYFILQDNE